MTFAVLSRDWSCGQCRRRPPALAPDYFPDDVRDGFDYTASVSLLEAFGWLLLWTKHPSQVEKPTWFCPKCALDWRGCYEPFSRICGPGFEP